MFVSYCQKATFPKSNASLEYKFHVNVEAPINSKTVISQVFLSRQKKVPNSRNTGIRYFHITKGKLFIIKPNKILDFLWVPVNFSGIVGQEELLF